MLSAVETFKAFHYLPNYMVTTKVPTQIIPQPVIRLDSKLFPSTSYPHNLLSQNPS